MFSCTIGQHFLSLQNECKMRHRTIVFYKSYFEDFFVKQNSKVKNKIIWTFDLIEELPRIPERYLKHIGNAGDLYEIRVQFGSDGYRIFCFFEEGKIIVLANGFLKKSKKTPDREIEKAIKIKGEYEREKK
jgi:phage-related protein